MTVNRQLKVFLFTTNDCMDAGGRAMQELLPRHEEHEEINFVFFVPSW